MDHVAWIDFVEIAGFNRKPGKPRVLTRAILADLFFPVQFDELFRVGEPCYHKSVILIWKWQITVDKNIGLDVTLFNKRFSLTADYYYKVTDPLLIG